MGWFKRRESRWEVMAREAAKVTLPDGKRVTFDQYLEWRKLQKCEVCGKPAAARQNGDVWITETYCGCGRKKTS
jgi:hypothetical protein